MNTQMCYVEYEIGAPDESRQHLHCSSPESPFLTNTLLTK